MSTEEQSAIRGSWEPGVLLGSPSEQLAFLEWERDRTLESLASGRGSLTLRAAHRRMLSHIDARIAELELMAAELQGVAA